MTEPGVLPAVEDFFPGGSGMCRQWCSGLAFAIMVVLACEACPAEQPGMRLAATEQMPAALQAIGVGAEAVVTEQEAAQLRGNWLLTLDLPLFAAVVRGEGPFQLYLLTLSGGVFAGYPVEIRLTLGR